jgi:ectoine hydroxylase-related dioxygenase (phytanoyl-CoA dioxygenase family)
MPNVIVDAAIIERFRTDGFVVVPDVFTDEELDHFGAGVDAAVADDMADDVRTLAEKSRSEQSFLQCLYLWTRYPDVLPFTCHPRLAATAAHLVGADAVRIWHDQALYKEPGGRPTDPHQDQPFWPIAEPRTITAWIPLDGSTVAGGAMAYYPGSHRIGLERYVDIFGPETPDHIGNDPALVGTEPVRVEVPRGGVAFHHGLTAHLAEPNRTDRVRRVHTVIYVADGCHRSDDRPHLAVDFDHIRPGGLIDGTLTPVLWPRPPGDLPEPPAPVGARRPPANWTYP